MTPNPLHPALRKLHAQGLTDQAIGEQINRSRTWVGQHRRKLGLPSNHDKSSAGRKGGAASPYASPKNRKRKPRAVDPSGRVERLDACDKCGMPFSISAPAAVAGRLHRLWESRHLCEPGRYDDLEGVE